MRHLNGEVCEMQTATTGRMPTAVKSGVQALESRMPEKRACPVWRRGRRKRVVRYLAGGLLYSEEGTRKRAATYLVGCLSYRMLRLGRGNGCKALCAASAADDECNESCWN